MASSKRKKTPRAKAKSKKRTAKNAAAKRGTKAIDFDHEPLAYAASLIRAIPNFPQPGILFRDITPLLADAKAFHCVIDAFTERLLDKQIQAVVAIESRGFIFGAALAARLNTSFVPVRKPGKLPAAKDSIAYSLEYGTAELQIHKGALAPAARVLIIDDLLATGGTAAAAAQLVRRQGATLVAFAFVIELLALAGRKVLHPAPILSLVQYE